MKRIWTTLRRPGFFLLFLIAALLSACSQDNGLDTDAIQAEAYLDIADIYRQQGQFRSAYIEIQNALQLSPGNDRALLALSRTNLETGNSAQAVEILEQLHTRSPDDLQITLLLAEAHLNSSNPGQTIALIEALQPESVTDNIQRFWLLGSAQTSTNNYEAARRAFQSALDAGPADVRVLIGLSRLAYLEANTQQARTYLDQAIEVDPEDLDLRIWRGIYATLNGQYPEAEQAFFAALELMSSYDMYTAKRFSVLQAILVPLQMQNKNEEAMRYSQIIAGTPQGQLQSSYSSAVEMFQQGDYSGAEAALQSTLAAAPDHPDSNVLLGMTNYALGNYSAAAESLGSFIDIVTSSQPIKTLAATQIQLGNPEEAITLLQGALNRFPEDGSLIAMLGLSQQSAGYIEESISSFREALELEPDLPEIHFSMAGSFMNLNDYDSAIESLERAISLNADFDQAKANLVSLYTSRGELELARARTQSWLEASPDSPFNNNLAGSVAYDTGNVQLARNLFSRSAEIDPSNLVARMSLARVALLDQNYDQAVSELDELLSRDPTNAEALSFLLSIGQAAGDQNTAVARVEDIGNQYPLAFSPQVALSRFHLSNGDLESSRLYADQAYGKSENPITQTLLIDVLIAQALTALESQDSVAANGMIQQAIALNANHIRSLAVAANVAYEMDAEEEFSTHIERLNTIRPGAGLGYEVQGDLLINDGRTEDALGAYRQAWAAGRSSSVGNKIYSTLNSESQPEQARDFLSTWLEARPQDGSANLLTALYYQTEARDDEAVEHYEIAYQSLPRNLIVLNNLAWLYQDSDPERALELSGRAVTLFPDNADAFDTYGWILLKQNRRDEAIEALQKALDLAPDSVPIAEHLETARNQQ